MCKSSWIKNKTIDSVFRFMDFFNQLEKHDFQVQKIAVKELYTKEEIERYRLDETEILPLVQKSIDQ